LGRAEPCLFASLKCSANRAANIDRAVWKSRVEKKCPFRGSPCTKGNVADPLGVYSIEEGSKRAIVCPVRFLEKREILNRAAA
jgi:hypothetical protein